MVNCLGNISMRFVLQRQPASNFERVDCGRVRRRRWRRRLGNKSRLPPVVAYRVLPGIDKQPRAAVPFYQHAIPKSLSSSPASRYRSTVKRAVGRQYAAQAVRAKYQAHHVSARTINADSHLRAAARCRRIVLVAGEIACRGWSAALDRCGRVTRPRLPASVVAISLVPQGLDRSVGRSALPGPTAVVLPVGCADVLTVSLPHDREHESCLGQPACRRRRAGNTLGSRRFKSGSPHSVGAAAPGASATEVVYVGAHALKS